MIPPTAIVGYSVAVRLIEEGQVVATVTGIFKVRKTGFKAGVGRFAETNELLYSVSAVVLALATGGASNCMGRR